MRAPSRDARIAASSVASCTSGDIHSKMSDSANAENAPSGAASRNAPRSAGTGPEPPAAREREDLAPEECEVPLDPTAGDDAACDHSGAPIPVRPRGRRQRRCDRAIEREPVPRRAGAEEGEQVGVTERADGGDLQLEEVGLS